MCLKADEPKNGQRDEDVERKEECYHIILFLERTWNDDSFGSVKDVVTSYTKREESSERNSLTAYPRTC